MKVREGELNGGVMDDGRWTMDTDSEMSSIYTTSNTFSRLGSNDRYQEIAIDKERLSNEIARTGQ